MRPAAWPAVLLTALVTSLLACDASDGGGAGTSVEAWCRQLDVAVTASATLDEMDRGDPGVDEAMATVQEEMASLADLEAPADIAGDWSLVSGPPPTSATGGFDLGGPLAEAGDRIAAGPDGSATCRAGPEPRSSGRASTDRGPPSRSWPGSSSCGR